MTGRDDLRHFLAALGLGALLGAAVALVVRAGTPAVTDPALDAGDGVDAPEAADAGEIGDAADPDDDD